MKRLILNAVPGLVLVTLAGTCYSVTASADAAGDCRQEALGYEIPAEQLDDYINGCLASRGELVVESSADMDYEPPAESDQMAGDTDATQ